MTGVGSDALRLGVVLRLRGDLSEPLAGAPQLTCYLARSHLGRGGGGGKEVGGWVWGEKCEVKQKEEGKKKKKD